MRIYYLLFTLAILLSGCSSDLVESLTETKPTTQKNLSTADRSATLLFTAPNMSPLTVVVKQYCFLSKHNNTSIVIPLPDVEE